MASLGGSLIYRTLSCIHAVRASLHLVEASSELESGLLPFVTPISKHQPIRWRYGQGNKREGLRRVGKFADLTTRLSERIGN